MFLGRRDIFMRPLQHLPHGSSDIMFFIMVSVTCQFADFMPAGGLIVDVLYSACLLVVFEEELMHRGRTVRHAAAEGRTSGPACSTYNSVSSE